MANKPVHIRYEQDGRYPAGAEFIVKSLDAARTVHPEATVLGYTDGSALPAAPKPPAKPTPKRSRTPAKATGPGPDAALAPSTTLVEGA